ncbi:F0F1 ATP synthase subunit epsilon [Limibaculum sp. M0105]|uniref:ATP synthase epsilon chain n=1 Tax=Thermohalobaculum xanthum TaxID=2753746 RepID=A0A8J7M874_9RHOB|nr:F0F1 ATP synthase subunit epsilon [Thermohalobaculum xanthum]MBK0399540.1 F0F1 ATP synthase subunit epsilon [Thermohalobaculum xanthum]
MPEETMQLTVFTPARLVLERAVGRIVAVGLDGSFGLLPRHVDVAAPLVPGILQFECEDGREGFVALDGGVLLKTGRTVRVAARRAATGDDLATLRAKVEQEFLALADHEQQARQAVARLEAGIIRRFLDLEVEHS